MRLDVVTIFPEYLEPLNVSLVGKARARGQLDVRIHDLRDWAHDKHNTVDDTPYGGGPGMVMKPEPWGEALDEVLASGDGEPVIVVPTPSGEPFTQQLAVELSAKPWLVFTPARYEGIDRRVIEEYGDRLDVREVSIGDYVLAGGEAAGPGHGRGRRPAAARRPRQRRLPPGRLLRPRSDGRPPGRPRLHQASGVARPRHPRRAGQRPPRQDRPLATRRGLPPHRPSTAPI